MDISHPKAVSGKLVDESAKSQRMGQKLVENYTDPLANEGNLLTLMTLRQFAESKPDTTEGKGIRDMAMEEMRYINKAIYWLTLQPDDGKGTDRQYRNTTDQRALLAQAAHLQRHHGRNMEGVVELAKKLKEASVDQAVDDIYRVPIGDLRAGDLNRVGLAALAQRRVNIFDAHNQQLGTGFIQ